VPIGVNLLPGTITNSLSGWTRIGAGTLEISSDVPVSFDPTTETSIKYTKSSSTLGTPESFNFYYLSTGSFWTPGNPYYLSFYAKSTVDAKITVGVRRNVSPFEYSADFFINIGTTWKQHFVPIVTDLAGTNVRLPFFAFGRVTSALEFYVTGIKLERGYYPTPRMTTITNFEKPIYLPNASGFTGTASPLEHYEEYIMNLTFLGPWSTGQTVDLKLTRIGKIVTLQLGAISSQADTASLGAQSSGGFLPASFRPPSTVTLPILIQDNNQYKTGHLTVDSSGTITVWNTFGNPWSGTDSTGWTRSSITYLL
jgi:hypothetical protein